MTSQNEQAILDKLCQELMGRFPQIDKLELYTIHNNGFNLAKIIIKPGCRNDGIGSAIMTEIVRFADMHGRMITLTPDTCYGASSIKRLERFYKSFGFVCNRGKFKDYSLISGMYRTPTP